MELDNRRICSGMVTTMRGAQSWYNFYFYISILNHDNEIWLQFVFDSIKRYNQLVTLEISSQESWVAEL